MNTWIRTLGLGLGGGGEPGTSWEQIWQALWRLLSEEYVKNESEYRNFKYLIPALILIHTFFIFQIKNLREFPISFILLLPWGHLAVTVPGTSFSSIWVTKRTRTVAPAPPPSCDTCCETASTPSSPLESYCCWISGARVTDGTRGHFLPSSPAPRRPRSPEMMQPSCTFKMPAQVLNMLDPHRTEDSSKQETFLSHAARRPLCPHRYFSLKLNTFYKLSYHHEPVLTWVQGQLLPLL